MVQLPEPCQEISETFKAGYQTIAEISKERSNQQSAISNQQSAISNQQSAISNQQYYTPDTGFRVLKIDTSNMADVYYTPDELLNIQPDLFADNIKPDRTDEDLLFQVMLDWGIDLVLPIEKKTI